jgi:predicted nucleic acid-binding protein
LIVLDTSGLYAALARRQTAHDSARAVIEAEAAPFILSPFVLAEVDYFVARWEGVDAEAALLADIGAGAYELAAFTQEDVDQARRVIETYRDLGIGLADASIVVLAGRYKTERILTLDERHFRVLRSPRGRAFTLLPADA